MNYYISDLHFFFESQLDNGGVNYDGRPFKTLEEMHAEIKNRWNARVRDKDKVYILGDVAIRGCTEELLELVGSLKGRKVLVKGNHDDIADERYKALFYEICDYRETFETVDNRNYKLVMSHYPILMWSGQHRGAILLYGHTHNSKEDVFFQKCIDEMNRPEGGFLHEKEPRIMAVNVGCMKEYMDYTPRTLRELLTAVKPAES